MRDIGTIGYILVNLLRHALWVAAVVVGGCVAVAVLILTGLLRADPRLGWYELVFLWFVIAIATLPAWIGVVVALKLIANTRGRATRAAAIAVGALAWAGWAAILIARSGPVADRWQILYDLVAVAVVGLGQGAVMSLPNDRDGFAPDESRPHAFVIGVLILAAGVVCLPLIPPSSASMKPWPPLTAALTSEVDSGVDTVQPSEDGTRLQVRFMTGCFDAVFAWAGRKDDGTIVVSVRELGRPGNFSCTAEADLNVVWVPLDPPVDPTHLPGIVDEAGRAILILPGFAALTPARLASRGLRVG